MAKTRPFIVLLFFFAISGLALAQEESDQPSQPSQPSEQQRQQESRQQVPEMERPIYLTGKVIYDDGSPADISVQVELVCSGRVRRQAYAFNGFFTLEVTQTPPTLRHRVMFPGVGGPSVVRSDRRTEAAPTLCHPVAFPEWEDSYFGAVSREFKFRGQFFPQ